MKRRAIRYDAYNDYYHVLGVPPAADAEAIHRAFRQRAKEVHPDRNQDRLDWANEQFRRLNEAHDILSDPASRSLYDLQRARVYPPDRPAQTTWTPYESPYPRPKAPPGTKFTPRRPEARPTPSTYYGGLLRTILDGPYRYVLTILALVFFLNVVFILTAREQLSPTENRATQTVENALARAVNIFTYSTTPYPTLAPTLTPTCVDPNVTITAPARAAELNHDTFDILGSAVHPQFAYYTIDLFLDATGTRWTLLNTFPQAVREGVLAKAASIANVPVGTYRLRLTVYLRDGRALPPCEIMVRRKP